MWQFREAVQGLVDGCRALGIPVTGGNVSFYNQTGDVAILPTPIVGVLGVIEDVTRRTPVGFRSPVTWSTCWARPTTSWPGRPGPRRFTVISAVVRRWSTSGTSSDSPS